MPAIGWLILGLLLVVFAGTSAATLPALFPTRLRYGALSIAYNISVSLFGGTTPLLASWRVTTTRNTLVPAYYPMVAGGVGLVAAFFLYETAGKPLRGAGPMVETEEEARTAVASAGPRPGAAPAMCGSGCGIPRTHPHLHRGTEPPPGR